MRVTVGSLNACKIEAVSEVIALYPMFAGAEVVPVEVRIETFGHPKSLQETIDGARERARQAFQNSDFSFGIEGGLMEVPNTTTGYMEVTACVIFDGKNFYMGFTPLYEWPTSVTRMIVEQGLDGSQALREAGLTNHEKIGAAEGGISLLTNGRLNRKEYTKLGIMMALVQLEHPLHY